jgi:pyruvate dehydrogenase E2 component (dihydrolipoamide acetyltransferase)
MATAILMPRMSDSMTEGTLIKWLKSENDPVRAGDMLCEIETDKATQEVECFEDGVLLKQTLVEGGVVPVGGTICILGKAGEDISELLAQAMKNNSQQAAVAKEEQSAKAADEARVPAPAESAVAAPAAPVPVPKAGSEPKVIGVADPFAGPREATADDMGGRLKASPLARKIAAEKGVSLYHVKGTGPGGRIVRQDVLDAVSGKGYRAPLAPVTGGAPVATGIVTAPAQDQKIPLSGMRRTIARRLSESKQTIPHVYTTVEVDAAPMTALRAQLNAALAASGDEVKISVNDLVLKATAQALVEEPEINAAWQEDHILRYGAVHLSFAVSLESGLVTPTIRNAEQKSLRQIALEAKTLGKRAKARELKPEEFTGGTFTVSNMGMMGVDVFQAIVNPPQAGILAVGQVREVPVVHDGQIVPGTRMSLTLSSDHRVVDGAGGARFLAALKRRLENPTLLLL